LIAWVANTFVPLGTSKRSLQNKALQTLFMLTTGIHSYAECFNQPPLLSHFFIAILAFNKWYENWLMLNIVVFFVLLPVARKFEHYVVLLMTSVHFALNFCPCEV